MEATVTGFPGTGHRERNERTTRVGKMECEKGKGTNEKQKGKAAATPKGREHL
jgi:hypothetical protein